MAWLKYENGTITGFAAIAPPSSEPELWTEVAGDDPAIDAFLNPPPQPERKWAEFRQRIAMHSAYLRIVQSHPLNLTLNPVLVWTLGELSSRPEVLGDVMNLWNVMVYNVPAAFTEAEQLRAIVRDCNLPFDVDDNGFMVARES